MTDTLGSAGLRLSSWGFSFHGLGFGYIMVPVNENRRVHKPCSRVSRPSLNLFGTLFSNLRCLVQHFEQIEAYPAVKWLTALRLGWLTHFGAVVLGLGLFGVLGFMACSPILAKRERDRISAASVHPERTSRVNAYRVNP
jgi:hypothetical protein